MKITLSYKNITFSVDADLAPDLKPGSQVEFDHACRLLKADVDRRMIEAEAAMHLNRAKQLHAAQSQETKPKDAA